MTPLINKRVSLTWVAARLLRASLTALLAAVPGTSALASEDAYPSKPIRWIVPYPPGNASDLVARAFALKLQERWHQPVIVENRPGAATNIGNELALRAPADGYTLLLTSGTIVINPALFDRLSYDPVRDFAPVSLLARSVFAILVPAQSPFRTFGDVLSYARNNPGQLVYGASGIGSIGHLAGEQLRAVTNISLALVPYTGNAQLANELAGGHLPLAIGNLLVHMPQIRSGRVRALLVFGEKRELALPDVPTAVDIGLPELVFEGFVGVSVRMGTPRNIVKKLADELQRIGKSSEIVQKLEEPGTKILATSAEEYGRFLEAETSRWQKVIRDRKIRVE